MNAYKTFSGGHSGGGGGGGSLLDNIGRRKECST